MLKETYLRNYMRMKSIKDLRAGQNQLRIDLENTGFEVVEQYEFYPWVKYGEDKRRLRKAPGFATE